MTKAILTTLLILTCAACQSTPQPTTEVTLPSGRKIHVIAGGQINFPKGGPALLLKYQTDLKLSDLPALRNEVNEIWPVFQIDVDKTNLTNAIISANEVPHGLILRTANVYNFVFTKSPDGAWHPAE